MLYIYIFQTKRETVSQLLKRFKQLEKTLDNDNSFAKNSVWLWKWNIMKKPNKNFPSITIFHDIFTIKGDK